MVTPSADVLTRKPISPFDANAEEDNWISAERLKQAAGPVIGRISELASGAKDIVLACVDGETWATDVQAAKTSGKGINANYFAPDCQSVYYSDVRTVKTIEYDADQGYLLNKIPYEYKDRTLMLEYDRGEADWLMARVFGSYSDFVTEHVRVTPKGKYLLKGDGVAKVAEALHPQNFSVGKLFAGLVEAADTLNNPQFLGAEALRAKTADNDPMWGVLTDDVISPEDFAALSVILARKDVLDERADAIFRPIAMLESDTPDDADAAYDFSAMKGPLHKRTDPARGYRSVAVKIGELKVETVDRWISVLNGLAKQKDLPKDVISGTSLARIQRYVNALMAFKSQMKEDHTGAKGEEQIDAMLRAQGETVMADGIGLIERTIEALMPSVLANTYDAALHFETTPIPRKAGAQLQYLMADRMQRDGWSLERVVVGDEVKIRIPRERVPDVEELTDVAGYEAKRKVLIRTKDRLQYIIKQLETIPSYYQQTDARGVVTDPVRKITGAVSELKSALHFLKNDIGMAGSEKTAASAHDSGQLPMWLGVASGLVLVPVFLYSAYQGYQASKRAVEADARMDRMEKQNQANFERSLAEQGRMHREGMDSVGKANAGMNDVLNPDADKMLVRGPSKHAVLRPVVLNAFEGFLGTFAESVLAGRNVVIESIPGSGKSTFVDQLQLADAAVNEGLRVIREFASDVRESLDILRGLNVEILRFNKGKLFGPGSYSEGTENATTSFLEKISEVVGAKKVPVVLMSELMSLIEKAMGHNGENARVFLQDILPLLELPPDQGGFRIIGEITHDKKQRMLEGLEHMGAGDLVTRLVFIQFDVLSPEALRHSFSHSAEYFGRPSGYFPEITVEKDALRLLVHEGFYRRQWEGVTPDGRLVPAEGAPRAIDRVITLAIAAHRISAYKNRSDKSQKVTEMVYPPFDLAAAQHYIENTPRAAVPAGAQFYPEDVPPDPLRDKSGNGGKGGGGGGKPPTVPPGGGRPPAGGSGGGTREANGNHANTPDGAPPLPEDGSFEKRGEQPPPLTEAQAAEARRHRATRDLRPSAPDTTTHARAASSSPAKHVANVADTARQGALAVVDRSAERTARSLAQAGGTPQSFLEGAKRLLGMKDSLIAKARAFLKVRPNRTRAMAH